MSSLDLAVIGNSSVSAMIDRQARIVFASLPRLDSDPVFCSLLRGGAGADATQQDGTFSVELRDFASSEQSYIDNTAVLHSVLTDDDGGAVEIVDFAPRYDEHNRIHRPPMLVRRITPVAGRPMIRVVVRPMGDYGKSSLRAVRGSHHIVFMGDRNRHRLTTNIPISYVMEERYFRIDQQCWILWAPDEPIEADLEDLCRRYFETTTAHWRLWVRGLSIPFEWQEAVIRAAITLKLCMFEETGAIVAALTTSIPEAPNTVRNWDYRYCWLRDAVFVIRALNRLGVTRTMEQYIGFITDVIDLAEEGVIQPVYGISREDDLTESIAEGLAGYRGMGPVRVGNAAYEQVQNDVYGSLVLAAVHLFFDYRLLRKPANEELYDQLEFLGQRAIQYFDKPDAGPWELRGSASVHTFSAMMCWAACDRLKRIARVMGRTDRTEFWSDKAEHLKLEIERRTWSESRNSFVSTFDGNELDASLLLMAQIGFVQANDARYIATVERIGQELKRGDFIYRYVVKDDFGEPETAFLICTFWYIDALASIGRTLEARALFDRMMTYRNRFGLFSEDVDPKTGELWGNFPQAYSMVGLINSAMNLSLSWEEAS
ncbi:glycoside hydrolase family 15 protein [Dongia sedimenti]|uniref:Glycoside hydrolase family 15 protein n=1 Tax=Dongia sedimenti TaxID=3064282 RepID=A0ABU0YGX5_9PROT|nr:glycoside hydrolase family 15 protein [Rhodospirillaceae bacterium R-7]